MFIEINIRNVLKSPKKGVIQFLEKCQHDDLINYFHCLIYTRFSLLCAQRSTIPTNDLVNDFIGYCDVKIILNRSNSPPVSFHVRDKDMQESSES